MAVSGRSRIHEVEDELRSTPRTWLVTGAGGFIGSNLAEHLLRLGQRVVGLENFSTGSRRNVRELLDEVGPAAERWRLVEGDICDLDACREACAGVDYVLHQAALGSVPRSIADPIATNASNVDGFLNMLVASREAGVRRFVYAASSSTYGSDPGLPKVEDRIGTPLSPYAVTKLVNELYAGVFRSVYGTDSVGLRYFNVFGRRQDPAGAYAAVIPAWIANLLQGRPCRINGDGETSRDFCYIENVVQANLLAATAPLAEGGPRVFNVAYGQRTTLNTLFELIRDGLAGQDPSLAAAVPEYADFRPGDVRHSEADISLARGVLGYEPGFDLRRGLARALPWYVEHAHVRGGVPASAAA